MKHELFVLYYSKDCVVLRVCIFDSNEQQRSCIFGVDKLTQIHCKSIRYIPYAAQT